MKKLNILSLVLLPILLTSCGNIDTETTISNSTLNVPSSSLVGSESTTDKEEFIYPVDSYFVSVDGTGDGTINNPCSLKYALNSLDVDKPMFLHGGTYKISDSIRLTRNGTKDNPIMIKALGDGEVILDFGYYYDESYEIKEDLCNSSKCVGIYVFGSYYDISGITVKAAGAHGMRISGSNNKVSNCVFRENGNTGLQITGDNKKTIDDWPSNNYILNCTSFGNYDWIRKENKGEDADGFACKLCAGYNNVFDGCVAYNNSDDGWDLFTYQSMGPIGAVTIKNSIAFNNGIGLDGSDLKNGNGFKLGGRAIGVNHKVINSIAFNNKANGFDDNSNPGEITLTNCTGFNNGYKNFSMGRYTESNNTYNAIWSEWGNSYGPIENVPKSHNVFNNLVSYKPNINDAYVGFANNTYFSDNNMKTHYYDNASCNYKYSYGKVLDEFNPFVSVDYSFLNDLENINKIIRDKNNNISLGDFLKPKTEIGANLS